MKHQPPRLARKFFKLFAGAANIDDLLGDLDEWFHLNADVKSPFRAKLFYWKQVLSLTFSYAIRKRKRDASFGDYATSSFSFDMLRNYLKVAIRNLYQYRYFSVLNAFGLAIGMSISLLTIALFSYVRTYDNFHLKKDRIYTVTSEIREGVDERAYALAPHALAQKIEDEYPGVEEVVRIIRDSREVVTSKENLPVKTYYVEPSFLSVLTFPMKQGNPAALLKPNQVILTESAARRIFNEEQVIGKTFELALGDRLVMNTSDLQKNVEHNLLEVAGVMQDIPKNSQLDFDMLVSLSTLPETSRAAEDKWTEFFQEYVYVILREGQSPENLQRYLTQVADKTYAATKTKISFGLIQLEDVVMGEDLSFAIGPKWDVIGFMILGLFSALILLPACFNYTNISIARAMKRAKEIGLRKTMGGVNKQIFFQFITETVVITLLSFVGALLIFVLIRGEFQSMLVAASKLDLSFTPEMVSMFVAFALFAGFIAGIFPAMYFSRLNPIEALKNKVTGKGTSMKVRKVLTVFQFALSFGFILALVVFSKQYRYTLNFDFGFAKKNVVDVELQDVNPAQFKTAFSQIASVGSVSFSSGLLGLGAPRTWMQSITKDSVEISEQFIDRNFIGNFGLHFVAGTNFPDEPWQRERHIIVNEEFVKAQQITNPLDIIGKTYIVDGLELEVIGVLKNFHYEPLDYPIGKFVFRSNPSKFVYANLQVTSNDAFAMFTQMENTWKQLPTEKKFLGQFFEEQLNDAYSSYRGMIKMVGFLGVLAITISLLGMLGMVVYTAETKTKEVSIRKVMGASIAGIALLLSRDYLKMMGWAIVLSVPATAFMLSKMLEQLQYYRASLSIWDVAMSAMILVGLGVLTILSQTYKTASTNPATTLRSE